MTKDLNNGIENIEYNVFNLPKLFTFANGGTIRYTYSATGRKLRAEYLKARKEEQNYRNELHKQKEKI